MSLSVAIVPVTAFAQNCTVVMCNNTKKAAITDPGGDTERILEQLKAMDAVPEKILLTHGHIDHAGASKELARVLNIPIIGPHKADLFWLQGLTQQAAMFNFKQVESFEPDQIGRAHV